MVLNLLVKFLKGFLFRSFIEWQQVATSGTTSDNERQRMTTSGTMNDNDWQWMIQRVTTSDTTSDNEWQQMTTSGTTNENEWKRITARKESDFGFRMKQYIQRMTTIYSAIYIWETSYKFVTVTKETAWKQGDAMLWNSLGQFRKVLIKIGVNENLMALSMAPK